MELEEFTRRLPKAELHVHIEGTLEPEMMFELARRNDVALPFESIEDVRAAYDFTNLQSFLDIYYQGAAVLVTQRDFRDLMLAYLERAKDDGVRRAEMFFDPQTHTERGIGFDVFMPGFLEAMGEAEKRWGISSALIMCFLRHLSPENALETWEASAPYREDIVAVGLDSSEIDRPPHLFVNAYEAARAAGLHLVAHAGEEGPADYVVSALDELGVERIDHGVRSEDDPALIARLVDEQIPLTMCPLSNIRLRVFDTMADHNLRRLLDQGVKVTINSDDPAYFGGYVLDNYLAATEALGLTRSQVATLARNSIEASFLAPEAKAGLVGEIGEIEQSMQTA